MRQKKRPRPLQGTLERLPAVLCDGRVPLLRKHDAKSLVRRNVPRSKYLRAAR